MVNRTKSLTRIILRTLLALFIMGILMFADYWVLLVKKWIN